MTCLKTHGQLVVKRKQNSEPSDLIPMPSSQPAMGSAATTSKAQARGMEGQGIMCCVQELKKRKGRQRKQCEQDLVVGAEGVRQ
jgi:hypothetical protein